jgi:hypothetical protein
MNRRTRIIAALVAIATIAFSQLALSAFICSNDVARTAVNDEMPPGHCDQGANANLCDRHCDYGASNVGHASLDAPADVLALPLPWRAQALATPAPSARTPYDLSARSHTPPPLALFGALRI